MPEYHWELPEGPVLEIRMQSDPFEDLRGNHVHLCPRCFCDVACDDWCTWDGESRTSNGVPTCHPVICERCEEGRGIVFCDGGGI